MSGLRDDPHPAGKALATSCRPKADRKPMSEGGAGRMLPLLLEGAGLAPTHSPQGVTFSRTPPSLTGSLRNFLNAGLCRLLAGTPSP